MNNGFGLEEKYENMFRHFDWKYNDKVFIVYGHDNVARFELVDMLTDWGLTPLMIDQLPTEGNTIMADEGVETPSAERGIAIYTYFAV